MRRWRPSLLLALGLTAAGILQPLAQRAMEAAPDPDADPLDAVATTFVAVPWVGWPLLLAGLVALAALAGLLWRTGPRRAALALAPGALGGAAVPLLLLSADLTVERGAWLVTLAALLLLWRMLVLLSEVPGAARQLAVPALFGATLLYLWEVGVRGFGVPLILLPPPSLVWASLVAQGPMLAGDFTQTVLRSALRGYVIGCAAGFVLALVCDRFPRLGRGLLPYGTLLSALPMVGLAPIMIMWFGFGWESKAAVVAVTTLFPMLVNTLAGLAQAERIERDLLRSYAAGYGRTLLLLRLPHALPFVFNALKINSTFALIAAIVAEFFGTPIAGMGFRISTEVARMNLGMVWATIAVAAVTGSLTYGGLALIERSVTFWHPSTRHP